MAQQEANVGRNNRRTAILLWLIVAIFFFGIMLKYHILDL